MPVPNQLGQPQYPSPLAFLGRQVNDPAQAYQDSNVLGQFLSTNIATLGTDPFANGAFGDGVHDDTKAIQQALNQSNGVLYLRPNKTFLVTATLTFAGPVYIYGGGKLFASSSLTMLSLSNASSNVIYILDVTLVGQSGGTLISVTSNSGPLVVDGCTLQGSTTALAIGSSDGCAICNCTFSLATTAIALTNATDVTIANCTFFTVTNPVSTTGTCTFTVRGCGNSVIDAYPASVIATTATAGGGQAVPATVKAYIIVEAVIGGTLQNVKIPVFSP